MQILYSSSHLGTCLYLSESTEGYVLEVWMGHRRVLSDLRLCSIQKRGLVQVRCQGLGV